MRFWKRSLTARLVIYFCLLAVVPLSIVGYVAYNSGKETLTRDILDHLNTTAILKEDEINRWIDDKKRSTRLLAQTPIMRQYSRPLLTESKTSPGFLSAYDVLGDHLTAVLAEEPDFLEIFILTDVGGKVVLSTNKEHEGEYNVTSTYFTEGRKATYVQNVYFSVPLGRTTMTIATPLEDETGQRVGVFGTHINLDKMSEIMLEKGGLGVTGETYLVDKYNVFVSQARFGSEDFPRGVHTEGIDAALQGNDGTGLYEDYRGVPVIGAYRWMEDRELALLAEIEQREAFAPVRELARVIVLVGLGVIVGIILIAYLSARQISGPIVAITEAATKIADGDLGQRAPVTTKDEVGVLAKAFNSMAAQLWELIENLEQRVVERTREFEEAVVRTQQAYVQLHETHKKLEATTHQAQRRALRLETAAEVSRTATSVLDPDELVRQAVDLIRDRFNLYYVGLFLLDESGRWAVLRAGTGEPGHQMLEAGHKLEVSGQSMVGWCTTRAQARIALDVGEEAVRFDNPLLPETRSEMALPLISRGRVIGALDVQSVWANAFSDEDIAVLQTMADQIAVAIDNARLFAEAQARLAEVQAAHRSYLRKSWDEFLPTREATDYEYVQPGVTLLSDVMPPQVRQVMVQQRTLALAGDGGEKEGQARSALVAPITLRGQVIGALGLHEAEETRQWTADEVALVEAVADQMALAIENARLFEEARTRAEELAVLNELGQALTARLNVEEVLEESYRGASRLLDASNFYIGLYDPEKNEIALVFNVTESAQDVQITVISADQGLSGYIIRNRTSVLLKDNVRARREALGIEMVGEESLSWLGVPLIVGDQVLGVMAVQSYTTTHAYDEHDRDLLTAIASQAAIAIQSARLFEQTEEALAETRALYEASRAIAEAITIEGILQAIVDHVITTDVDRCSVLFNNVTTGKVEWMELVATWDRAGLEQGLDMPIGTRIYARQFPLVGLYSKDDPFVVNNTAEDERLRAGMREVIIERMQAQSFAMIPLATFEQGLGTLMIICRSPHAFTERELRLYQSVADRAAIAIENRRLLEATQARARRERLIREITGKVQRSVDLDTILRTTVQELGRALGASHAVVRLGTEAELATPHVEGQTDSDVG